MSKMEWLSMKTNEIGPVGQVRCANAGALSKRAKRTARKSSLNVGGFRGCGPAELLGADLSAKLLCTLQV